METDLNKLRDMAYKTACEHGLHDEQKSDDHWLMLVITEVGNAVNASRKNKYADIKYFKEHDSENSDAFKYYFETCIKDTVEDKLADIVIRLLVFAGVRNINIDLSNIPGYSKEYFDSITFSEASYYLCKIIINVEDIGALILEETVEFSVDFIIQWCEYMNIDLFHHIELKMRYNDETKHLLGTTDDGPDKNKED